MLQLVLFGGIVVAVIVLKHVYVLIDYFTGWRGK